MFGRKKREAPPAHPELRCSFCNKTQRYVKKMIAGPNVNICDECVDICLDVLNQSRKDEREVPLTAVTHCALCGMPGERALALDERGFLCAGCTGAVEASLAARA
jgi:hypothetical protein